MIRGTVIALGDKQYLLPPLNAAALELHGEFIQQAMSKGLAQSEAVKGVSMIAELVYLALKRNYPDLVLAEVKDQIDFGNMEEMMALLFKTSGFVATVGEPMPGSGPTGG
jgi:hypothetical protein